jgi:malate dehydrogenase (oxaloacetate-decarboxylating)(NADP+)
METQRDLSLAYTPGVAEPCLAIKEDVEKVFDYTSKGNLVAVVTDGTAVLGLGNIGPEASKPVMEGKAVLFKRFANIDVFDIEVNAKSSEEFINVVEALEPTFGGINLEDIKAPECFIIEETLKKKMDIPVFHDDQHGTAIIAAAAFVNALELQDKSAGDVKCVFSGAGAAAMACAELLVSLGVERSNITMCDSRGVIYEGRGAGMNPYKSRFARSTDERTLADAMSGADVFIGVSVAGMVTKDMVRSMNDRPVIMALANPDPEITYEDAKDARQDVVMATGRSDYPNQVNNVLGFPFIFRGALDVRATGINEAMKLAAVNALARLAREEVPEEVKRAYGLDILRFGLDYIIPKPFDHRALLYVAPAVACAAIESGVARKPINDWKEYHESLERILGREREIMRKIINKAARDPRRIVFPEGDHPRIIRAAQIAHEEGIAKPILLGPRVRIEAIAAEMDCNLDGIEIQDHFVNDRLERYVKEYWKRRQRYGVTQEDAIYSLRSRNTQAVMMVELGDADGVVSGMARSYPDTVKPAFRLIGARDKSFRISGAYLVILPEGLKIFADTTVNIDPSAEDLAGIAISAASLAKDLDMIPKVAMLSFSNFGSVKSPQASKIAEATTIAKTNAPDLDLDGEMQVGPALKVDQRERLFPFSDLKGEANVLIFPDLSSANIAYKLMGHLGKADLVGPILTNMNKPFNALERDCSVRSVINMTAITVVQAQDTRKS